QAVTIPAGQNSAEVKFQLPNNTAAGTYNIVLQGSSQVSFSKDPKANKVNVNFVEAVPGIPLTGYSRLVGPGPAARGLAGQPGGPAPLAVELTRLANYKGPIKLELVSPPGFTGVSADPVTVGPNETEGKLVVKAAGNAKQVTSTNVLVRATADKGTKPQEARI